MEVFFHGKQQGIDVLIGLELAHLHGPQMNGVEVVAIGAISSDSGDSWQKRQVKEDPRVRDDRVGTELTRRFSELWDEFEEAVRV